MEPKSLDTRTAVVEGRPVVSVSGDVDLVSSPELRRVLDDALEVSPHVVVDVGDMSFIDSSGLSTLVDVQRRAREAGGGLTLRRPSRMLSRLLHITRLETVLAVEDADDATGTPATGDSWPSAADNQA